MTARGCARLLGSVAMTVGVVLLVAGGSAAAAESSSIDDLGWWSRANQDATIGAALASPDVDAGQLLVEGTPEGATAIGAFRATLPQGSGSPVLTLRAASSVAGDTAVLLACQAGSGWTGAHAGSWDAKPSPDCSQSVQGIPEEGGEAWTFSLAPLQFDDQLNVVLTPGVDGSGAGSSFRVVFDEPTPDSIVVTESNVEPDFAVPTVAAPDDDSSAPAASGGPGTFAPAPSPPAPEPTPFTSPRPPSSEEIASQPAQAALPPAEQGQTATAPVLGAQNPLPPQPLPASSGDGDGGRMFGLLVVLCAGGLLYWSSQQQAPERRVLSRFAATAGSTTPADGGPDAHVVLSPTGAEDERMGGLGRFRRARESPARRIGG